ncbi:MAG TPA: 4-hydroxythreonine-4-phosphate dehydrogenase PdxA, partial [Burkholderiaceae bacterium]|nr:4-hydroxythreonine-4-phosphate dehydrogenase PdxA [Burkholderiaceae bacterium]
MSSPTVPIGITMGDPCGIGPEIVVKACADPRLDVPVLVFGDPAVLARAAQRLGLPVRIDALEPPALASGAADPAPPADGGVAGAAVRVVRCATLPSDLPLGRVDARAGEAAYRSIVAGARAALDGRIGALVTAPIHKEALRAAGVGHPGHTEL